MESRSPFNKGFYSKHLLDWERGQPLGEAGKVLKCSELELGDGRRGGYMCKK